MELASILNVIKNAQSAVKTATEYVKQFQHQGVVLTATSEAEIEAEIAALEALLPDLRAATQAKLRGEG